MKRILLFGFAMAVGASALAAEKKAATDEVGVYGRHEDVVTKTDLAYTIDNLKLPKTGTIECAFTFRFPPQMTGGGGTWVSSFKDGKQIESRPISPDGSPDGVREVSVVIPNETTQMRFLTQKREKESVWEIRNIRVWRSEERGDLEKLDKGATRPWGEKKQPSKTGIPFRPFEVPLAADEKATVNFPADAVPMKGLYLMHTCEGEGVAEVTLVGRGAKRQKVKLVWGRDLRDTTDLADKPNCGTEYAYPKPGTKDEIRVTCASRVAIDPKFGPVKSVTVAYTGAGKLHLHDVFLSQHDYDVCKDPLPFVEAGERWRPVRFPDRQGVIEGSALDVSAPDVIPVGKYGRLVAGPNGRLVYEKRPDLSVRGKMTWACAPLGNYAESAALREAVRKNERFFADFVSSEYSNDPHRAIENLAKALRLQGYNFVRVTGAPGNAFRGLDFEPSDVDSLCYLIKCFRENGIYIHWDTASVFTWTSAWWRWGENFAGRARFNAPKAYWLPDVRQNWEDGMRTFMTLVNPYTGVTLAEEPVIAFLELANESNLRPVDCSDCPEAQEYLADWLKRKYGDLAGVKAAWGKEFDEKWTTLEAIPANFKWMTEGDAKGTRRQDMQEIGITRMNWFLRSRIEFLRKLGCKQMITEYNMIQALGDSRARLGSGYIAHNAYHNHPFGSWQNSASSLGMQNAHLRGFTTCQYLNLPYVITEADIVYPSHHRYEQPFAVDAYAALNGLDVVTGFCTTMPTAGDIGRWYKGDSGGITEFFGWFDPIKLATEFLGAHFLTRGKVREADVTCRVVADPAEVKAKGEWSSGLGTEQTLLALVTRFALGWTDTAAADAPPAGAKTLDIPRNGATVVRLEAKFSNIIDAKTGTFDTDRTIASLKEKGWLPRGNRTDVKKGVFESSTGELYLDAPNRYGTLNAPAAQGLFAEAGATADLRDLKVVSMNRDAMFCVVSKGDEPLRESRRMAVVYASNALNTGTVFRDGERCETLRKGGGPVLLETGRVTFTLQNDHADRLRCWALDLNGARTEEIPVKAKNGRLGAIIDTAKLKEPTVFFELGEE